jgi:hypothetical protein
MNNPALDVETRLLGNQQHAATMRALRPSQMPGRRSSWRRRLMCGLDHGRSSSLRLTVPDAAMLRPVYGTTATAR